MPSPALVAILPCNDLDACEAFYHRLGFERPSDDETPGDYRMLSDKEGRSLHLTAAVEGWLVPGRNPFGLYLYTEAVDGLAAKFEGEIVEKNGPEDKLWGMYEFALSDPEGTLVRIGWPTKLRSTEAKIIVKTIDDLAVQAVDLKQVARELLRAHINLTTLEGEVCRGYLQTSSNHQCRQAALKMLPQLAFAGFNNLANLYQGYITEEA